MIYSHPIGEQHFCLVRTVCDACHFVGQFQYLFCLYCIGGGKRIGILNFGGIIGLGDQIQFEELVAPSSIVVNVQVYGSIPAFQLIISDCLYLRTV